jgi:hypothetical protein
MDKQEETNQNEALSPIQALKILDRVRARLQGRNRHKRHQRNPKFEEDDDFVGTVQEALNEYALLIFLGCAILGVSASVYRMQKDEKSWTWATDYKGRFDALWRGPWKQTSAEAWVRASTSMRGMLGPLLEKCTPPFAKTEEEPPPVLLVTSKTPCASRIPAAAAADDAGVVTIFSAPTASRTVNVTSTVACTDEAATTDGAGNEVN